MPRSLEDILDQLEEDINRKQDTADIATEFALHKAGGVALQDGGQPPSANDLSGGIIPFIQAEQYLSAPDYMAAIDRAAQQGQQQQSYGEAYAKGGLAKFSGGGINLPPQPPSQLQAIEQSYHPSAIDMLAKSLAYPNTPEPIRRAMEQLMVARRHEYAPVNQQPAAQIPDQTQQPLDTSSQGADLPGYASGGQPKKYKTAFQGYIQGIRNNRENTDYDTVDGYRADPYGKYKQSDKLESQPTTYNLQQIQDYARAAKAAEQFGGRVVDPNELTHLALIEGRSDFGYNGLNSMDNKKYAGIYNQLVQAGHTPDAAGFAAMYTEAHDNADRLNKPFPTIWNGTGQAPGIPKGQYQNWWDHSGYAMDADRNSELKGAIQNAIQSPIQSAPQPQQNQTPAAQMAIQPQLDTSSQGVDLPGYEGGGPVQGSQKAAQIPGIQLRDLPKPTSDPTRSQSLDDAYRMLTYIGKKISDLHPLLNLTQKAAGPASEVLSSVGKTLEQAKIPPIMPELGLLESSGLESGRDALSMFPELADKYLPAAQPHGTFNMGIAYHGSPHKFEKFDASKIGTGEGHQTYGYGLYFAEAPETAATYSTSPNITVGNILNKEILPKGSRQFADRVEKTGSVKAAKEEATHLLQQMKEQNIFPSVQDELQNELDLANKFGSKLQVKPTGATPSLYTVNIPDEHIDRMLDWDKPLSEQHPAILDFVKSAEKYGKSILDADRTVRSYSPDSYHEMSGAGAYDILSKHLGGQENASKWLNQIGIPGIKYLDQGSRGTGEGTRNIVVFPGNENIIEPISRNDELLNP